MKKLINVTFALLLLCSAVTLVSCGKDDDKKGGSEAPEGTRELTQNGITDKTRFQLKTKRESLCASENYRWRGFTCLEKWCTRTRWGIWQLLEWERM